MLQQAQAEQWQEVLGLGEQYQAKVKQLQNIQLDNSAINEKRQLLQQILNNEAKVRELMAPKLDELSRLMGSGKNQRSAIQAYYETTKPDVA